MWISGLHTGEPDPWGPGICISQTSPGVSGAAGLQSPVWEGPQLPLGHPGLLIEGSLQQGKPGSPRPRMLSFSFSFCVEPSALFPHC